MFFFTSMTWVTRPKLSFIDMLQISDEIATMQYDWRENDRSRLREVTAMADTARQMWRDRRPTAFTETTIVLKRGCEVVIAGWKRVTHDISTTSELTRFCASPKKSDTKAREQTEGFTFEPSNN